MKWSNKLLIGFTLVVFITPLLFMLVFSRMIKTGDYITTQSIDLPNGAGYQNIKGEFGPYNVVQISTQELENAHHTNRLICHLHSAQKGHYAYKSVNSADSVSIINKRDTLFITYAKMPPPLSSPKLYAHYNIDLYLPDMRNIIVNRATIQMDSINPSVNPNINFLLNEAVLQIGNSIPKNKDNPLMEESERNLKEEKTSQYHNLSIYAQSSQLIFGYRLQIDSLRLDIEKDSKIIIANDFHAGKIIGSISDQTSLVSNLRVLKRLKVINDK